MLWSSHGTHTNPPASLRCSSSLFSPSTTHSHVTDISCAPQILHSQDPHLQSWTDSKPRTFCFQSPFSPQRTSRLHFPRSFHRFQKVTDNVNSRYHIQQTTADSTSGISKRFRAEKQIFFSGHIWQQWSTQRMAKALFLDRQRLMGMQWSRYSTSGCTSHNICVHSDTHNKEKHPPLMEGTGICESQLRTIWVCFFTAYC